MNFEHIIKSFNDVLWGTPLICMCLGAGIYFSLKTRFLQIRLIKDMLKLLLEGKSSAQGISSFQALAVSLSGRVGTGNIAGVATAIALGGPGAVFWMWLIAFLGAATAFVESSLAQIYKVEKDGQYRGGPAYYIEKGLKLKWYAVAFAVASIFSCGFFLPGIQANSIAVSLQHAMGIPKTVSGAFVVMLLSAIVFGGIRRIGRVAEYVVPFMAIGYVLCSLIIVAFNLEKLPAVLSLILSSAFGAHQVFGGIVGSAISFGVKRGIFSNEAGQGSAAHAAGAAEVTHPAKQGLVQAFSVYIDTLFVCSATAFMILITGQYNVEGIVNNIPGVEIGPMYTQKAVETVFGVGPIFVAISLFFFAFTTLMAYYYIAETNVAYLKKNPSQKWLITALRIILLASTFYGSIKTADLVWAMGDIGVALMTWLNLVAIFMLRKPAFLCLQDYERQKKLKINPVFRADDLGIANTDFWTKQPPRKTIDQAA